VRFESCGVPLNDKKDLMALLMRGCRNIEVSCAGVPGIVEMKSVWLGPGTSAEPSPAALNAALNALEARAQFDGLQLKVSLRTRQDARGSH
jgi:hypothetical protein